MITKSDSAMSESTVKHTRREIRRAFGDAAVGTLESQNAVINSLRIELATVRGNHHDLQTDFRAHRTNAGVAHIATDKRSLTTEALLFDHLKLGFVGRIKWLLRGRS